MLFFMRLTVFMPSVDDNDVSLGIGDKMRVLNVNDKKNESSQQIQEEANDVKNNDLLKEWRYAESHP